MLHLLIVSSKGGAKKLASRGQVEWTQGSNVLTVLEWHIRHLATKLLPERDAVTASFAPQNIG